MIEVGRDLWTSSSPTPLLISGSARAGCSGLKISAFKYLQGWRHHNVSGQSGLTTLTVKSLLTLKWNFLYFSLCLMLLLLPLGATEESLPLFFTPSHHMFIPYCLICLLLQLGLAPIYTAGRMIILPLLPAAEL